MNRALISVLFSSLALSPAAHGQSPAFVSRSPPFSVANSITVQRRGPYQPSPQWATALSSTNSNDSAAEEESAIDPELQKEVRNLAAHLSSQPVQSILPRSEALLISRELMDNMGSIFTDEAYDKYVSYWGKLETRLREETTRTPADLLGSDVTDRILSSIRGGLGGGGYDPGTVRTFLESDAISKLFAKILFDAIFEFTLKADVVGNLLKDLPIIGPMRQQLVREQKRQLDRTLGPLVQRFLGAYTRVAVGQAADFVVSGENADAFGKANVRLVQYLLQGRTVAEWIPERKTTEGWREDAWEYLRRQEKDGNDGDSVEKMEERKKDVERYVVLVYDFLGDKCAQDAGVDVDAVLDASPALERSAGDFWKRCKEAAAGDK